MAALSLLRARDWPASCRNIPWVLKKSAIAADFWGLVKEGEFFFFLFLIKPCLPAVLSVG